MKQQPLTLFLESMARALQKRFSQDFSAFARCHGESQNSQNP